LFDYAYAITCHKAQGGEWPGVLVMEGRFGRDEDDRRRWCYTAASRAQEKLYWHTDRPIRRTAAPAGKWVARATNGPEGGGE
jgi:ATP-dependent exoDNAse (exonuclease V) alpha subunit